METTNNKKIDERTRRAILAGHYQYLMQALAVAMQHTLAWRLAETGDVFTVKELYEFAVRHDAEQPLNEYQFYMVSGEGAIGISPGLEWLTRWMFTPMEPGEERDEALRGMQKDLEAERAAAEAVEKAVNEGLERERLSKAKYMMLKDGRQLGPFTAEQLKEQKLTTETYVWTQGMAQWAKAKDVEALAEVFTRYYMLDRNNQRKGPFRVDELISNGLTMSTYVWTTGMKEWVRAATVDEIANALAQRHG